MDDTQHSETPEQAPPLFMEEVKEEESQDFFLFELDGALYAVTVSAVEQVLRIPPITTVPNAPDAIIGIFHLRGRVIVALDPLRRMGLTRKSSFVPIYLFITHKEKNYFAVLVDRVRNVVRVKTSEIMSLDPVTQTHVPEKYATSMFMHRDVSHTKRKTAPDFLIQKKGGTMGKTEDGTPPQPVIILNVAMILDQNDLLSIGNAHLPPLAETKTE